MNKAQRLEAAERIQRVHEGTAIAIEEEDIYYDDNEVLEAHNHRAELLTLLADAERENDYWQWLVGLCGGQCDVASLRLELDSMWKEFKGELPSGLDALLNKQESSR